MEQVVSYFFLDVSTSPLQIPSSPIVSRRHSPRSRVSPSSPTPSWIEIDRSDPEKGNGEKRKC